MLKHLLNLQMFGEGGGDGSSAGASATAGTNGASDGTAKSESLDEVVYGKQTDPGVISAPNTDDNSKSSKGSKTSFDELIKGEYKEDFQKKTQAIIDKRFKETKGMEATLNSHSEIMEMLASKYGVDSTDVKALRAAIEEDDSFYEDEALEKGLTVKQLKEVKRLERENEAFRKAEEEQMKQQKSQEVYNAWTNDWDNMVAKYGFDPNTVTLENEVQNPDFTRLLQAGIGVESAYKAIHMDDMLGGAMARTASTVRTQMANSIASRQSRPAENGLSSKSSQIFKSDPSKFTNADMLEIRRRVMRGEKISL